MIPFDYNWKEERKAEKVEMSDFLWGPNFSFLSVSFCYLWSHEKFYLEEDLRWKGIQQLHQAVEHEEEENV